MENAGRFFHHRVEIKATGRYLIRRQALYIKMACGEANAKEHREIFAQAHQVTRDRPLRPENRVEQEEKADEGERQPLHHAEVARGEVQRFLQIVVSEGDGRPRCQAADGKGEAAVCVGECHKCSRWLKKRRG